VTEDQLKAEAKVVPWHRHRFVTLIGGTIVISLFLVGVALALYASSGAAQLDLSRPGYKSVREQAARSDNFEGIPATGTVTQDTITQFRSLYNSQAQKATNVDTFGGDPMSDKTLSIDDPANK
jgi:hypothetical protein